MLDCEVTEFGLQMDFTEPLGKRRLAEKLGTTAPTIKRAITILNANLSESDPEYIHVSTGARGRHLIEPKDQRKIARWWQEKQEARSAVRESQITVLPPYEALGIEYSFSESDVEGAAEILDNVRNLIEEDPLERALMDYARYKGQKIGTAMGASMVAEAIKSQNQYLKDTAQELGFEGSLGGD